MTLLIIITFAIAVSMVRSVLDAVRTMRYHQMQARSFAMPFDAYALEYERESRAMMQRTYYRMIMEQRYGNLWD